MKKKVILTNRLVFWSAYYSSEILHVVEVVSKFLQQDRQWYVSEEYPVPSATINAPVWKADMAQSTIIIWLTHLTVGDCTPCTVLL